MIAKHFSQCRPSFVVYCDEYESSLDPVDSSTVSESNDSAVVGEDGDRLRRVELNGGGGGVGVDGSAVADTDVGWWRPPISSEPPCL
eukprot:scaffold224_cov181-Alexandrium_tamarense.AAC.5